MSKVRPIREQLQHFVRDLKESFWGALNGKAPAAVKIKQNKLFPVPIMVWFCSALVV